MTEVNFAQKKEKDFSLLYFDSRIHDSTMKLIFGFYFLSLYDDGRLLIMPCPA